jgi:cytoskeleton protein RodZ
MSVDVNPSRTMAGVSSADAEFAETVVTSGVSVGQQLRAAREAMGMATVDVAKALKLSPRQVAALEADDWSLLPCNTIMRGFVRNYARLLDLNSDAFMSALDSLKMPEATALEMPIGTQVSVPHAAWIERRNYVKLFTGLIALVLAACVYFFPTQKLWQSTVNLLGTIKQSREPTVDNVIPSPNNEGNAAEVNVTPMTGSGSQDGGQATPLSPVSTPASLDRVLKFNFDKPAWVEVRDRSGVIIFSQLSQAGSSREVEGQPPFSLVVGNAGYVTLFYKDKPVDLSKRSKDDVARVTVE